MAAAPPGWGEAGLKRKGSPAGGASRRPVPRHPTPTTTSARGESWRAPSRGQRRGFRPTGSRGEEDLRSSRGRGAALTPGGGGGRKGPGRPDGTRHPGRSALRRTEGATPTKLQPRDPEAPIDEKATLRQAWPREEPGAAKCVRSVDDQCVLQFTLVLAASCVLHRRTSRVIHR